MEVRGRNNTEEKKITVPCSDISELWSGAIVGIKSQKPLGSLTNPSWDARAAERNLLW